MAQRCGVCGHPKREEVDELLRGQHNVSEIARDLAVTRWAVIRHRDKHVWHGQRETAVLESPQEGEEEPTDDEAVRTPPKRGKVDPQTAFLTAYAASCDIKQGLKAASITRAQLRKWQEHDPAFNLRFHQAETEAIESLEYEARLRAIAGSKLVRRVYRQGLLYEEIHEWRPSDAMMTKLLQAAKPEKYGERLTVTQTTVVKAVDAEAWAGV